MPSSPSVTPADLRAALALIESARVARDEDFFYGSVLVGLRELIPCDDVYLHVVNNTRKVTSWVCASNEGVRFTYEADHPEPEFYAQIWATLGADDGRSFPFSADGTTVLRRFDRIGDLDYSITRTGSLLIASWGVLHEVMVPLPSHGVIDLRLTLCRAMGSDFSERDLLLLRMIRPHLGELYQRRQRELNGQPNLTHRQWEIMRMVATGASNRQVAKTLNVSEATVSKHLENVFQRLHVASRTEAVDRLRSFIDLD